MGHGKGSYLSDKETVDKVYALLKEGDNDGVEAFFKGLGEDKVLVPTWINVQCDINNIHHDPLASSKLAIPGIEYCISNGYNKGAAMMLHNISAFFMPNFDEGVDPEHAKIAVEAARRQVPIRREIGEDGPLMWAMWDLGLAELAAGNVEEAIKALDDGELIAEKTDGKTDTAWCKIFSGKAKLVHKSELKDQGKQDMLDAGKIILEHGADWEKESVEQIWGSVKISLDN